MAADLVAILGDGPVAPERWRAGHEFGEARSRLASEGEKGCVRSQRAREKARREKAALPHRCPTCGRLTDGAGRG